MIKFGVQDFIFLLLFLHDKSSLNYFNELFMSCVLDRTSKTHQLFFPEHQGHHEQSYHTVILHKSSLSLGLDGWILQNGSCQQLAIHFPIGSCHMFHDALTIGHDWTMDLQIRLQQKWMQGRNLLVIDTSLDVSPVLNSEFVGYWVEFFLSCWHDFFIASMHKESTNGFTGEPKLFAKRRSINSSSNSSNRKSQPTWSFSWSTKEASKLKEQT